MRKTLIVGSCLVCCLLAATLFQYSMVNKYHREQHETLIQNHIASTTSGLNKSNTLSNKLSDPPEQPWFVHYELLPNKAGTQDTKRFLESLHDKGYVGEHDDFQRKMPHLESSQILANMLLGRDEAHYLHTVSITPNMLTKSQLQACSKMSFKMLNDLKAISSEHECTHEQKVVLNVAVARLSYLNFLLTKELNNY